MRPTNLGFKDPREIVQAPFYNPTVLLTPTVHLLLGYSKRPQS